MPLDASGFPRVSGSSPSTEGPADCGGVWVARSPGSPPRAAGQTNAAATTTVRLLRAARALIQAEQDWGRGAYQSLGGRRCAVGALHTAAARAGCRASGVETQAHALLLAVAHARGFAGVERMNDASTHAQVLAAFDDATRVTARR